LTPATGLPHRSAAWTLADAVDFEFFLAGDAAQEGGGTAPPGMPAMGSRRDLFLAWVRLQRSRPAAGPTPGQQLQRGEAMLAALALGLGLVLGAALAGVWLAGSDAQPVNAPLFWAATVGVQLLLLALGTVGWLWRRRLGRAAARAGGGWHALLQALISIAGRLGPRLPAERRHALRAALGRLAARRDAYGGLLARPAVALAQRFGLAFNAGLLFAMLVLHLPLVDLRFGWQSTYPITAAQMHRAVQAVAAPWRWAWPQAQPGADDVAATRYSRGQAAATLPADAARAWWPFLALSIAVYGLLLRGALLLGLRFAQRQALARLRFDHPEANALWRRLAGPLLRAQGGEGAPPALPANATGAAPAAPPGLHAAGDCVALVAQDLAQNPAFGEHALQSALRQRFGWTLAGLHHAAIDDRAAASAQWSELAARQPRPAALVIVAPAQRDPIVAVALFLRAALQAAGPGVETLLLLVDADPQRLALWRRFVQAQRLAIGVEAWGA
jgi:hypothetical protein